MNWGRRGSASDGSFFVWSNDLTVTATFGIVFESTFLTVMLIVDRFASDWRFGNLASTTWILYVPSGSSASWRSPPPHPATKTAQASAAGMRRLVKAREPYHRTRGDSTAPLSSRSITRSARDCTSFIEGTTFLGCVH